MKLEVLYTFPFRCSIALQIIDIDPGAKVQSSKQSLLILLIFFAMARASSSNTLVLWINTPSIWKKEILLSYNIRVI